MTAVTYCLGRLPAYCVFRCGEEELSSLFLLLRTLISLQTIHWMANHSVSLPWPVMLKKLRVELFYEDLQDLLELPHTHTHTQTHHFHHRGLEFKSRKSRDTWNNSSLSRAKANRVLHRKHNGHSKHPLPTTKKATLHMDITKWSILKSDWLIFL